MANDHYKLIRPGFTCLISHSTFVDQFSRFGFQGVIEDRYQVQLRVPIAAWQSARNGRGKMTGGQLVNDVNLEIRGCRIRPASATLQTLPLQCPRSPDAITSRAPSTRALRS